MSATARRNVSHNTSTTTRTELYTAARPDLQALTQAQRNRISRIVTDHIMSSLRDGRFGTGRPMQTKAQTCTRIAIVTGTHASAVRIFDAHVRN